MPPSLLPRNSTARAGLESAPSLPFLIEGSESSQLTVNQQSMYTEGAPEFVVDQGLHYPTATNYGYYCTGFGAPSDWEDHHRIFGVDGPDVQLTGVQTESLPYVYYTPSYGYAESQYNPYNPYIPGMMIGVDSPFVGAQQYYTVPPYQNSVSSGYVPILVQPDMTSSEALFNAGAANIRSEGRGSKNNFASPSATFGRNSSKTSNHANSLNKHPDGAKDAGLGTQAIPYGGLSGVGVPSSTSTYACQGRSTSNSTQPMDNNFSVKVPSHRSQIKVGFTDFGTSGHAWISSEKSRPKFHLGRVQGNVHGPADSFGEQNRGPRTNRPKSQLAVKAYTAKAGNADAQGIIIIDTDQYNNDDFPLDYEDAKFFVIKSYSEDDVHKSIKYNVWSSTPHGNKKLQNAYDDAQRFAAGKPNGCPIFLFFSVNASGQFCGVAEMIGPVDFHMDMDFWQQDKWSGSFPVKWHFVKDVQNTAFRHIILENNENKPVTNSRDTQEVFYRHGMEMLRIFKNHTLKTSILDDFMYYENRQKMMQEERARLPVRSFQTSFSVHALDPPCKLLNIVNQPLIQEGIVDPKDPNSIKNNTMTATKPVDANSNGKTLELVSAEGSNDDMASVLKIGSLTINPKNEEEPAHPASFVGASRDDIGQSGVLTVGSMPVKVNGLKDTSGSLTVGTIPFDGRALKAGGEGAGSGGDIAKTAH